MKGNLNLTQQLLNSIAYHLSGRAECRGATYRLAVGMEDAEQETQMFLSDRDDVRKRIWFSPSIDVFPSIHERKPGSQIPVISHIILSHFRDEVFDSTDDFGNLLIREDSLVPGIYEYRPSEVRQRRRWVRVK